jgi:tryptophanyl-tRNA synthetase
MSRIDLNDPSDLIEKKLKKAVTDTQSSVTYEPEKRLGVSTLLDIHAECTGQTKSEIVEWCKLNSMNTGLYKQIVAQELIKHLKPIQANYARLIEDKAYLKKVLDESALKANQIAANI